MYLESHHFYHHCHYYLSSSHHPFSPGHCDSLLSYPLCFPVKCPPLLTLNNAIKCKSGQVTPLLQMIQGLCLSLMTRPQLLSMAYVIHYVTDLLSNDCLLYPLR